MRGIFFDEDDARAAVARLRADGYDARAARERFAGEDDDEDHPWAVTTDAPETALDLLVERYDGWLEVEPETTSLPRPVIDLPSGPRRHHRPPGPAQPPV